MPWMRINIDEVLRQRLPRHHRFIPRGLVRLLERLICQKELNEILDHAEGKRDGEFCRSVLDYLKVGYSVKNAENLPRPENRRVTYVSNHPLGGLDGIALIEMLTKHHGVEPYFIVNDLLMAVEPLQGVFVPVNTRGKQNRNASGNVDAAFASDRPLIVFPAGLVSRMQKDGHIEDKPWRKSFINRSIASGRDVYPLFFDGANSATFYRMAKNRERIGLKFNFEMIRLPKEVMLSREKHFDIYAGPSIAVSDLKGGKYAEQEALNLKKRVYSLKT